MFEVHVPRCIFHAFATRVRMSANGVRILCAHASASQLADMPAAEMEAGIRQCSQRNLQSALREVEAGCEHELDAFVRTFLATVPRADLLLLPSLVLLR